MRLLLLILILSLHATLRSETWGDPTEGFFGSASGAFLLRIQPGSPDEGKAATGILYEREPGVAKAYEEVQRITLSNAIRPLRAAVSNNGQYVVTTDDYGAFGVGENVVVIYGMEGKRIARFSLRDLLPSADASHFSEGSESIPWGGIHSLDDKRRRLVLKIKKQRTYGCKEFFFVAVDLKSGRKLPP